MSAQSWLQLRWERALDGASVFGGPSWRCHYELVLPLREFDLRRENDEGEVVRTEIVVPMKEPMIRGSTQTPCQCDDGLYFDTPFRDGAHAKWDAEALGGLPIFVIAPDGTRIPNPVKEAA